MDPINVITAEEIGSKYFMGSHHDPRKGLSMFSDRKNLPWTNFDFSKQRLKVKIKNEHEAPWKPSIFILLKTTC